MSQSPIAMTKTDRALQDRMMAFAGDRERVDVIARARTFKASWIDLADALSKVYEKRRWERWGFDSFEAYCKKELAVTPSTANKLLGSFRFLRTTAPKVIERAHQGEAEVALPSLKAVDFVARAAERGAADAGTMKEIKKAAFDEGAEAGTLSRRFKTIAFPVSEAEKVDKLRSQLAATARRLANLIAEPEAPVPHKVGAAVEEAIGRLLEVLDN